MHALALELYNYHMKMVEDGLVTGTQGNISCRCRDDVFIKPSGVQYSELSPEKMSKLTVSGQEYMGQLSPSTDTASHLYIYSAFPKVKSVIHTHSTYATAFAACGLSIPVCLTAMADEFGGRIPCSGYAEIGGEEVGKAVVKNLGKAGVVLIQNHGLFAVGETIGQAYKRALMAEDSARTMLHTFQLGQPIQLTEEQIDSAYKRYHTSYGQ